MNNLKVLIVEDQDTEAAELQNNLVENGHQVIAIAKNLQDAISIFPLHLPDICIIDIYLNGRADGIVFATEINKNKRTKRPFLFLTSAEDSTTFQLAKLTSPYSYLLKPFNKLELQYSIELAIDKFAVDSIGHAISETDPLILEDIFFIKKGNTLVKIELNDIKYIEVEGRYSKIICRNESFLVQQPLKELQAQLPAAQFSRVHRNYIVNIKEVTRIDTHNNEILFKDGNSLFFSRRYLDELLHFFKIFK